jgi:hypothetical protein
MTTHASHAMITAEGRRAKSSPASQGLRIEMDWRQEVVRVPTYTTDDGWQL